jgi:epoxyqueuosine reductase QueG
MEPTMPDSGTAEPGGLQAALEVALERFFAADCRNRLPAEYGGRVFSAPIVGVARANDPIFERFKSAVAPDHLTPAEMWRESGLPDPAETGTDLRTVSVVFPYAAPIREEGKRNDTNMPPEVYCVARNFADSFIEAALEMMVRFLQERGYRAVACVSSRAFRVLSDKESGELHANWSERHVAFAAGLGTFSLHEALITQAGCNVRIGSVITDAPIEVTPRLSDDPYANCLHFSSGKCGACIPKCPAGAISKAGHDKHKCRAYGRKVNEEIRARGLESTLKPRRLETNGKVRVTYSVGCALCQFGTPCSDRNPSTGAADEAHV